MTDEPEKPEDADAEETASASDAARSPEPAAPESAEGSRAASEADADSSSAAGDEAAEPVAEEEQEPDAAQETPKPRRRRRKAAEPVAEEADEATEAVAAEAAGAGADAPEADVEELPAESTETAEPARPARSAPSRRRGRRDPSLPAPVVRAQAKYVRSSARKARLVCDHIRGKSVEDARAILALTPRAIARDWSKLLESAVANAEHNHELVGEDLYVKAVHADEGPTIKRFRPRAMGRATRIRKRTSHLTILLTPKD
jgi:large subunit ribosomal protein L22